jgi:SAM-dependent methyltransferase
VTSAVRIIRVLQMRLHRHLLDRWQDWLLGIDASGRVWPSELSLKGPNAEQASEYIGTPTWVLRRALDRLNLDTRNFVFVDLGSGKGRVILRAAARPFRRVEGVEFSELLHRIALKNIANAQAAGVLRSPVIAHNQDVAEFDVPKDPLVIYSFNPFGKKIMKTFVKKLGASLRAHPRDCYFIYLNPQHRDCFNEGRTFTSMPPSWCEAVLDRLISPWPLIIYRYQQKGGTDVPHPRGPELSGWIGNSGFWPPLFASLPAFT